MLKLWTSIIVITVIVWLSNKKILIQSLSSFVFTYNQSTSISIIIYLKATLRPSDFSNSTLFCKVFI